MEGSQGGFELAQQTGPKYVSIIAVQRGNCEEFVRHVRSTNVVS